MTVTEQDRERVLKVDVPVDKHVLDSDPKEIYPGGHDHDAVMRLFALVTSLLPALHTKRRIYTLSEKTSSVRFLEQLLK